MSDTIFIPFKKELYDDLVRFSDGAIDPVDVANSQVMFWLEQALNYGEGVEDWFAEFFPSHERLYEFVAKYFPNWLDRLRSHDAVEFQTFQSKRTPLVWKEVTVPGGSEVRMVYRGQQHYAEIKDGQIVDADGEFSPSSWTYKITKTARNAWRDLWFKFPGSKDWVHAEMLRQRARRSSADNEEIGDA